MNSMQKIFVYGTFKDKFVQKKLFHRDIEAEEAKILNYAVYFDEDGYYFLKKAEGEEVQGYILYLNQDEIWLADQWEEVPLYERIEVKVLVENIEKKAWAYMRESESKDLKKVNNSDNISNLSIEQLNDDLNEFINGVQGCELPYSDIYLAYPAHVLNRSILNKGIVSPSNIDCKRFIDSIKNDFNIEFSCTFIKNLQHYFMGNYKLKLQEEYKERAVRCNIFIALHEETELATILVSIPACPISEKRLFGDAYSQELNISKSYKEKFQLFAEWVKANGLELLGRSRGIVFSSNEIEKEDMLSMFVAEASPISKISSEILNKMTEINLAQYESASIYASSICLIEIAKEFKNRYYDRISSQTLTLFIIELLLLQEAAICRFSDNIKSQIIIERANPLLNNSLDELDRLLVDFSKSNLYWDANNFIYPTAKFLAQGISKAFDYNELIECSNKNKQLLEQLIDIHNLKKSEIESKNINNLLLLLAFIQVLPLIATVFENIVNRKINYISVLSFLISFVGCIIIWLIYTFINKIQKQKYKSKHIFSKK